MKLSQGTHYLMVFSWVGFNVSAHLFTVFLMVLVDRGMLNTLLHENIVLEGTVLVQDILVPVKAWTLTI